MKIALVGATGMVGSVMLKVLCERKLPVSELIPVASDKSVGKEIAFGGKKIKIVSLEESISLRPHIALFSAGASISKEWAPKFKKTLKPVIEDCYKKVLSGEEARRSIKSNSQPNYWTELNKELEEINNQEMWIAGKELRKLRPENL